MRNYLLGLNDDSLAVPIFNETPLTRVVVETFSPQADNYTLAPVLDPVRTLFFPLFFQGLH